LQLNFWLWFGFGQQALLLSALVWFFSAENFISVVLLNITGSVWSGAFCYPAFGIFRRILVLYFSFSVAAFGRCCSWLSLASD
jgi:hypothetical protein